MIELEQVDIQPILEEVVATSESADGVELRIDCPTDLSAFGPGRARARAPCGEAGLFSAAAGFMATFALQWYRASARR
jgi:hypothetical protein